MRSTKNTGRELKMKFSGIRSRKCGKWELNLGTRRETPVICRIKLQAGVCVTAKWMGVDFKK